MAEGTGKGKEGESAVETGTAGGVEGRSVEGRRVVPGVRASIARLLREDQEKLTAIAAGADPDGQRIFLQGRIAALTDVIQAYRDYNRQYREQIGYASDRKDREQPKGKPKVPREVGNLTPDEQRRASVAYWDHDIQVLKDGGYIYSKKGDFRCWLYDRHGNRLRQVPWIMAHVFMKRGLVRRELLGGTTRVLWIQDEDKGEQKSHGTNEQ